MPQTQCPELDTVTLTMPTYANGDPNPGRSIYDLVGPHFSDVDSDPIGAAIIAASSPNGIWQYTLAYSGAGSTWTNISVTPPLTALRLHGHTANAGGIRFVPNGGYSGPASGLELRAWDRSDGVAHGNSGNIGAVGGVTAYSNETATVDITVTPGSASPTPGKLAITPFF